MSIKKVNFKIDQITFLVSLPKNFYVINYKIQPPTEGIMQQELSKMISFHRKINFFHAINIKELKRVVIAGVISQIQGHAATHMDI